jgi:hypothetical protein
MPITFEPAATSGRIRRGISEEIRMKHRDRRVEERRSLITGLGLAAAGIAATAAAPAQAQRSRGFTPERHSLDAWMGELPGGHRIFIDSATGQGGSEALLYANNLYNAHQTAYSGSPGDLAMVVCFRHFSTPFGYTDAVWEKYGEQFAGLMQLQNGPSGGTPTSNPANAAGAPGTPTAGVNIGSLVAKGVQFAICDAATHFVSTVLAGAGGSADDIYKELAASLIPNGRLVPAGVMAVTRSQEYGYSLLYAG